MTEPQSRYSPFLKGLFAAAGTLALLFIPLFVRNNYAIHLFIMAYLGSILGIAFSMFFSAGLITLGIAAFYMIGAYSSSLLAMKLGLSFWISFPLAILITAAFATGLGAVIVRHAGATFVVITLIFNLIVVQAASKLPQIGGWGGLLSIPRPSPIPVPFLGTISFAGKVPYYYLILLILLLGMALFYALYQSQIGRAWKAIKLSPQLAETLGISLFKYRLLAMVVASSFSGAAGGFYAHYSQSVVPDSFGALTSIYAQLYSVLGGLDYYLLGPFVGAIIMIFLPEALRITHEIEPLITGALLVILIVFFPGGILGTIRPTRRSLRKKTKDRKSRS